METIYFGKTLMPFPKEHIEKVKQLKPELGTCIFIDICNSTLLKTTTELHNWLPIIGNSLSLGQNLPSMSSPLKVIGDELMYYITDNDLISNGMTHQSLFNSVKDFMSTWGELGKFTLPLKAAIHYCTDVYPITFMGSIENPIDDYYGSGIDLTARLMSKTVENRIVISEEFFVKAQFDHSHLAGIQGPYIEDFKGFLVPTMFRYRMIKR